MRMSNRWVLSLALLITTSPVSPLLASGFQISEVSVAGLGRAYAGLGVGGDSISEMFANPASLALSTGTEVEFGLHAISSSAKFENQGSTQTLSTPTGPVTLASTGPNSDAGENSLVPNIFFAGQSGENLRYGLSITSPFGPATEYDPNWVGRYAAIKSELTTVDINPMVAYTVGPISFGLGINILKTETELTQAEYTGIGSADGLLVLKGDDTSYSWNAGFVTEDDTGRFGVGYRSHIDVTIDGTFASTASGTNAGFRSEVRFPATYYISGLIKANPKLDLLGSLRVTEWSSFDELRFQFDNGMPDTVIPENWSASNMLSAGFTYRANDSWTYRGGIALDETPVSDQDRTARIPDTERFWVSLGGRYMVSNKVRVDFGYAHIFGDTVPISETTNLVATAPGLATDNLSGSYNDPDADILSVAVSYHFGNSQE
jgi:long-chain fatty acid transport protein